MIVVHTFERLDSYMLAYFIVWAVLVALVLLFYLGQLAYDCIYEYVSEQLDHCNYFGENLNE